jgi:ABC-type polysaccharide transport system permease subunit
MSSQLTVETFSPILVIVRILPIPSVFETVWRKEVLMRRAGASPGTELVEWIVVTIIMIIATYAILQAVGSQLTTAAQGFLEKSRIFFSG